MVFLSCVTICKNRWEYVAVIEYRKWHIKAFITLHWGQLLKGVLAVSLSLCFFIKFCNLNFFYWHYYDWYHLFSNITISNLHMIFINYFIYLFCVENLLWRVMVVEHCCRISHLWRKTLYILYLIYIGFLLVECLEIKHELNLLKLSLS